MIIRPEQECDYDEIRSVVKRSFAGAEHTDSDEHNLIDRLRRTDEYIPELSLVAEVDGLITGYAMFSRIRIATSEAITLAPLAVLPEFQSQGIGKALIAAGHRIARKAGFSCCVILGSPDYYSMSGYLTASGYGIAPLFDVPQEYYMVCPLNHPIPSGTVHYSPAFGL